MRVYIKNQQRLIKVNQHRIKKDLRKALHLLGLHSAEISILFVNDKRMKILNRQYRGVDKTTDVLSFSQIEDRTLNFELRTQNILLGDIVINLHQAKRQAAEHNLTFNEELRFLLIHGLLHLIGYDHEKGGYARRKMQKKTLELLEELQKE
ncbi:MAG: rRNA maturation RNase YbeY [Nitrospira sp.]|nr:rRNA maturation RNase YbeY [Nitrospira sp.]